ncbi:bifunctional adenosylcobinamide kinase/adenosylcobinamide-phosphate guanylyltransferase [Inhella inkyongensis]|nr:bifunctional adenosylcobinamide kinase/adenosylcobinamide-phosphate guanylyltransferase [Inhella inkyongensis]
MKELILGGARSGKSARAEARAAEWLAAAPGREAWLIATAHAGDEEMVARIARHREDRARRCPGLRTLEEPVALGACIRQHSAPERLLLVDCLTLWLSQALLPPPGVAAQDLEALQADLLAALRAAPGPVVLVSNEIGLGLMPLQPEARAAVDALGRLHQQVAAVCERLTLMVAGQELRVKG